MPVSTRTRFLVGLAGMLIAVASGLLVSGIVDLVNVVEEGAAPWQATDVLWLIAIVALPFVGSAVWFASGRRGRARDRATESEPR